MRFRGFVPALILAAGLAGTLAAQYSVVPAAGGFSAIAGAPGATLLTTISGCDDCSQTVTLPFPFPWFVSGSVTSVVVSSNGHVALDGNTANLCCSPWALDNGQSGGTPAYTTPIARVSVAQEDLNPGQAGDVWTRNTGSSTIFSWESVPFYPNTGVMNAQVELFTSGDVEVRFGTVTSSGNNVACGLTRPSGGVTTWLSPASVLPQFNAVGQTVGGVIPQNTGVRFTSSGLFAGFTATPLSGNSPVTVNFTDTSYSSDPGGVTTREWDFQNDGIVDSTLQNPSFVYTVPGTYSVRLTVYDTSHPSSTLTRNNYVSVGAELLVISTSGAGDVALSGPDDPPGTTEGFLFVSASIPPVAGTGFFFGLNFDATVYSILSTPATACGLFHYLPHPACFPNVNLAFGPGSIPPGATFDAVLIQVVAASSIIASNVDRTTF